MRRIISSIKHSNCFLNNRLCQSEISVKQAVLKHFYRYVAQTQHHRAYLGGRGVLTYYVSVSYRYCLENPPERNIVVFKQSCYRTLRLKKRRIWVSSSSRGGGGGWVRLIGGVLRAVAGFFCFTPSAIPSLANWVRLSGSARTIRKHR